MLMRSFITTVTYLFIFSHIVFGTIVNISAPDYKNQTIIWKKKIDYISNQYEIIDKKIVDSNGLVKLNFRLPIYSQSELLIYLQTDLI